MKYNTLGPTGLLVSEICLGTMTFAAAEGIWKHISGVDQNLADQLLKSSFDAGVYFVDTADVYTNGESEKTLAKAISNRGLRPHCRALMPDQEASSVTTTCVVTTQADMNIIDVRP